MQPLQDFRSFILLHVQSGSLAEMSNSLYDREKYLEKLMADLMAECEQLYDTKIVYGNTVKIKYVKKLRKSVTH